MTTGQKIGHFVEEPAVVSNKRWSWLLLHIVAGANLNKSEKVLTSTTTASKYIPKRPRICINWNPPFQTQIYLVKVPLNVNIVKQDLLNKKTVFENFMKWCLKGGISIDTDSGPLWCCGSRSQDFFTFIQIGSWHTVTSAHCLYYFIWDKIFGCTFQLYKIQIKWDHIGSN